MSCLSNNFDAQAAGKFPSEAHISPPHRPAYNEAMDVQGKIALVTGASRRLGRAIALELAQAGADMVVHYGHAADQARHTAEEIRAMGRRAEPVQADLAEPDQIVAMFARIAETFGRLDVLVNCAGVYNRTPIDTLSPQQWDAELAVNARGPALCIRHAAAMMDGGGAIVNITDIAAEKPWPAYPAYCASKAALRALTQSCAKALAKRNIRVNAVAPGAILWLEETTQQQRDRVLAQVPMKRIGTADDIAAAVRFFVQQDYITGQTLRVDGGWHMG